MKRDIEEVLYLGMHNDVSFLISGERNLFEQQSSFNPNMPLRMLQYTAQLFEKYVTQNHLDKFGSYLLELPVPRLIVFYNGTTDLPDETILLLSDSFPEGADQDIEVRVIMININEDHSRKILEDCRPLMEYSWLIGRIRKKQGREEFVSLLKKLVPDSDEYERALNAGEEELAELYRRYGIREEENYEDEEE